MEIKRNLLLMAFIITLSIMLTIILITNLLDDKREEFIDQELDDVINTFNEMQTLILMGDTYGDRMVCIISDKNLKNF